MYSFPILLRTIDLDISVVTSLCVTSALFHLEVKLSFQLRSHMTV